MAKLQSSSGVRSGNVTIRLQWQDLTVSIPHMFPVSLRTSLGITTDGDITGFPDANFLHAFLISPGTAKRIFVKSRLFTIIVNRINMHST